MTLSDERLRQVLLQSRRFAREGRTEENQALLADAVRRFPEEPELLLQLGISISAVQPEGSLKYVHEAVRLAPEEPALLFRCASLLFSLGEYDDSRAYAKRARTHATEDFPLLIDLIHLAGKLAEHKGNYPDAEKALRTAFCEDPKTPGHGRVLAEFYRRRARMGEALDVVAEARSHLPDDESLEQLRAEILAAGIASSRPQ